MWPTASSDRQGVIMTNSPLPPPAPVSPANVSWSGIIRSWPMSDHVPYHTVKWELKPGSWYSGTMIPFLGNNFLFVLCSWFCVGSLLGSWYYHIPPSHNFSLLFPSMKKNIFPPNYCQMNHPSRYIKSVYIIMKNTIIWGRVVRCCHYLPTPSCLDKFY